MFSFFIRDKSTASTLDYVQEEDDLGAPFPLRERRASSRARVDIPQLKVPAASNEKSQSPEQSQSSGDTASKVLQILGWHPTKYASGNALNGDANQNQPRNCRSCRALCEDDLPKDEWQPRSRFLREEQEEDLPSDRNVNQRNVFKPRTRSCRSVEALCEDDVYKQEWERRPNPLAEHLAARQAAGSSSLTVTGQMTGSSRDAVSDQSVHDDIDHKREWHIAESSSQPNRLAAQLSELKSTVNSVKTNGLVGHKSRPRSSGLRSGSMSPDVSQESRPLSGGVTSLAGSPKKMFSTSAASKDEVDLQIRQAASSLQSVKSRQKAFDDTQNAAAAAVAKPITSR